MSNRVSFASVLQRNPTSQIGFIPRNKPRTLSEYMDIYTQYGDNYNGYTLNFDQSGSQNRRNIHNEYSDFDDYEEGINPLDAWMTSQTNRSKESSMNFQGRKKNLSDLMNLVNSRNQPRNTHNLIQAPVQKFEAKKPQKNMNMKELCKIFAEQKDSCESSCAKEPVWKFNSRQSEDIGYSESSMRESIQ